MARPESSIMREEIAGLHEVIDALRKDNARKDALIEALLARVAELESEVRRLSGRNRRYEGPNAPPSVSSIGRGRRRRARAEGGGPPAEPAARPGPPDGHEGFSQCGRSDRTVMRRAKKCGNCGGTNLVDRKVVGSKQVLDAEIIAKILRTSVQTMESECLGCHKRCVPESDPRDIRDTWLGPGMATLITLLHSYHLSAGTITRAIEEILGVTVGETAVKKCIKASGAKLGPHAGRIRKSVRRMSHVHIDETTFGRGGAGGRQLWDWVAVGILKDGSVGAVVHHMAESRGEGVLRGHLHFDMPAVADGLRIYRNVYPVVQWCWAHILREAREANAHGRAAHLLYVELKRLFARAKGVRRGRRPGRPPRRVVREREWIEGELSRLAAAYRDAGCEAFGKKLANAAPHLCTFLYYPGMDPTNNVAERMLRHVVIDRRIRGTMRTAEGRRTLGTLLTCTETWKARGLNVAETLRRALAGEAIPCA